MPSSELVKLKIDTMKSKLDYMYVRLGGDDLEEGIELNGLKNLDEYQQQVLMARNKIKRIREDMDKRKENIKIQN